MIDQPPPRSFRWRSYLRVSVRTLAVAVLVVGAGLGWIVHCARVQQDAVAAIRRQSGQVGYDWEWKNGNVVPNAKPWAPQWLVGWLGVDYFGSVRAVYLDRPTILPPPFRERRDIDSLLTRVALFGRLEALYLSGSAVTDAGMAHLNALTDLRCLSLPNTRVSDAGLVHLQGMKCLEVLILDKDGITDAGLAHLKGLTALKRLHLRYARISDAGLADLSVLAKLESLDLEHTEISDAGLAHVKGLTNLRSLALHRTQVSDAGLMHLEGLINLQYLGLNGDAVTDSAIKSLGKLRSLKSLSVCQTKVSKAGFGELKLALSTCRIYW